MIRIREKANGNELVKQMLARHNLSPTHLLKSWDWGTTTWDKRERFTLSRDEFCGNMFILFEKEHPDLWDSEVLPVVKETFEAVRKEIKGGVGSTLAALTIVHIEKWLDDPPRLPALPLKTPRQLAQQAMRRRPPSPTVKKVFDPIEGIASARAKAKLLEDAKLVSLRRRWHAPTEWSKGVSLMHETSVPPLQRSAWRRCSSCRRSTRATHATP